MGKFCLFSSCVSMVLTSRERLFMKCQDFVIYENIVISKLYILVSLSFQSH